MLPLKIPTRLPVRFLLILLLLTTDALVIADIAKQACCEDSGPEKTLPHMKRSDQLRPLMVL